ncbi:type II toxin-antitoxin system RelE/ParE family toxin [Shewanella xiamenensis]|uniref:Type II toxin-antitoxin system RelE/ParE family toxin n=1 Tax=Shewanella chilikensis TaxID=558541 RepID=A0A6G7LQW5_9GAMM|nr:MULTISPECIES: type II toxin-antitoxin system RelE/ParE family toxin [Shewanella]MCT8858020.1 type II toxin-antitoxin system RelE/ParE family toxin [Shewanella xiamenensis]MDN5501817.1 type II toxin-antitoxin system RelE/ParE family toxin [Shewanella sp.]MDN5529704.1 type II toxin-antitoxin system RelE/ParE family toxin [Shewanella sp.]QIJ04104.1 type II toxin-antitoxin system RelE/ParE family toxin [Shewanella chilikensis]UWG63458.1 type II toxin-antitoxin system RelE/ParE family toxin [She
MSVVKLEYTKTFEDTVDSAISHYFQWHDEITIIERVEAVIEAFEASVTQNPLSHALCQELVELGITQVRHAIKEDFRILYEVSYINDESLVTVLLFLNQRQSIQNQLINHCLVYK